MIDEGETDWKLFCIDVNDPLAKDMNGKDELFSMLCPLQPHEFKAACLLVTYSVSLKLISNSLLLNKGSRHYHDSV